MSYGCDEGWSENARRKTNEKCRQINAPLYGQSRADSICNCYLEKLVAKFPQNNQRPDEILPIIEECSAAFPLKKLEQ
jgi:hypothetical protein